MGVLVVMGVVLVLLLMCLMGMVADREKNNSSAIGVVLAGIGVFVFLIGLLANDLGKGEIASLPGNLSASTVYETLSVDQVANYGVVAVLKDPEGHVVAYRFKSVPPRHFRFTGNTDQPFEPYPLK